ncbi:hypothetical protein Patl1_24353 [Pistacia atlantica]|uniref:Uncharacterized protein n=1 Tax=Pistacia atlantica TaxID=434234 RepID=A0ACC0ZVS8_9ROSI|nr:hypothetical protein Patl1_24353 [Pistacia atlantica]
MSSGDSLPDNVQTLWGLLIGIKKPPGYWLTDLRTLRLRSVNDYSEPSNLKLGSIEELHHLTELYLLGKFSSGIKEIRLPQSLKILALSVSNLKDDPMRQLGAMPVLRELEIRYCPNLKKIEGLKNFSTLKELKLTNVAKEFASEVKGIISEDIINEQNLETHPPWVSSYS